MEYKISKSRMSFKDDSKQIFSFAFVPVCGMDGYGDTRQCVHIDRTMHDEVDVGAVRLTIKSIAQFPIRRIFFNDEARPEVVSLIK